MAQHPSSHAVDVDAEDGPMASSYDRRPDIDQATGGNQLLRLLAPGDFALLQPHFERVPLEIGTDLASAGELIETSTFSNAP